MVLGRVYIGIADLGAGAGQHFVQTGKGMLVAMP
jgi:hypothetical protein